MLVLTLLSGVLHYFVAMLMHVSQSLSYDMSFVYRITQWHWLIYVQ